MDEKVADHTSSGTPIKRCRRGRGRWVPLVRWTSKEVRHRTEGKTHDRPGGPLLGSRRFPPAESSVGFHVSKTDKLVERKGGKLPWYPSGPGKQPSYHQEYASSGRVLHTECRGGPDRRRVLPPRKENNGVTAGSRGGVPKREVERRESDPRQ